MGVDKEGTLTYNKTTFSLRIPTANYKSLLRSFATIEVNNPNRKQAWWKCVFVCVCVCVCLCVLESYIYVYNKDFGCDTSR